MKLTINLEIFDGHKQTTRGVLSAGELQADVPRQRSIEKKLIDDVLADELQRYECAEMTGAVDR